jgi:hypothetical protein
VRQDALTQYQDVLRRSARREAEAQEIDYDLEADPIGRDRPQATFDPTADEPDVPLWRTLESETRADLEAAGVDLESVAGGTAVGAGSGLQEQAYRPEVRVDDALEPGFQPMSPGVAPVETGFQGADFATALSVRPSDFETPTFDVSEATEPSVGTDVRPEVNVTPGTDTRQDVAPGTDTDVRQDTNQDIATRPAEAQDVRVRERAGVDTRQELETRTRPETETNLEMRGRRRPREGEGRRRDREVESRDRPRDIDLDFDRDADSDRDELWELFGITSRYEFGFPAPLETDASGLTDMLDGGDGDG